MRIIGLSAFYHESACCLLEDGRLVAAASEERFSRVKHDPRLPVQAWRFCLRKAGIGPDGVDAVAYYEDPQLKLGRQLWAGIPEGAPGDLPWLDPRQPERAIRERLGFEGPILFFPHHLSHGASAYFYSGFPEAAVLTVDGVGEWASTTYGRGEGEHLEIFEEVHFPSSLGLLYSAFTAYLGFAVNDGEYKVMGLAPYGKPLHAETIASILRTADDGRFAMNPRYFDYLQGSRMFSEQLCELLGEPPRAKGAPITAFHRDVARSVQLVLEELLLEKVGYLHRKVGSDHLCMAGGVALNCVANARILKEGPFERLFVQPAAGDAGACLGAAALAHRDLTGQQPSKEPLQKVSLGPSWTGDEVHGILAATGLAASDFRGKEEALLDTVAAALAQRRIVGWFHGAMEFGPRALGHRSILANPLDPEVQDRLNGMVKKRESFRPFAPSVLLEAAAEHFDLDHPSPFMLETAPVRSPLDLPGITHVDGSARPQTVTTAATPRFAGLLKAFQARTECPILVNTSFNVAGEPIVCSPVDALFCFVDAGLDLLVLEDFVIDRKAFPEGWREVLGAWRQRQRSSFSGPRTAISENLYTFV